MTREERVRALEARGIADRAWVKANPGRRYHIHESLPGESGYDNGCYRGLDLLAATVLTIDEGGRGWWSQNILVAGPIIDSDDAAEHALHEYDNFIMPSLMTRTRYRSWSVAWSVARLGGAQ